MGVWQDLLGTTKSFFRIGLTGVRLKNNSGNLDVRNAADSAYAQVATSKLVNTGTSLDIGTTNVLTLQQNASQSGALTITPPAAKGTDGYVLAQKAGTASGVLELELISAGSTASAIKVDTTTLAFNSAASVSMFTLPASAVIHQVRCIIDTAFDGTPTATVGISGTTSKYMGATDNDLKGTAKDMYVTNPGEAPSGSTEALIITYSAGSATAGSARFEVYYSNPA